MKNKVPGDIGNFFDNNANFYGNVKPTCSDNYFMDFIKAKQTQNISILDIGGGAGIFAKLVKNACPDIDVTVIDPSIRLMDNICDSRIRKLQGELPNFIALNTHFDYIHVKQVFHHITGSSIESSKELLRESLLSIRKYLKDDGVVLIHELFYESYLIPELSRNLIFYLLIIQNKLSIKIPAREFLMDLKVCFYTRSEFKQILNDCGYEILDYYEEYWKYNFKTRALLLHNWGSMLFILKLVK